MVVSGSTSAWLLTSRPGLWPRRPCTNETTPARTLSSSIDGDIERAVHAGHGRGVAGRESGERRVVGVEPHHGLVRTRAVAHGVAPRHLPTRGEEESGSGRLMVAQPFEQGRRRDPPLAVGQHRLVHPAVLDREVEPARPGREQGVGVER